MFVYIYYNFNFIYIKYYILKIDFSFNVYNKCVYKKFVYQYI